MYGTSCSVKLRRWEGVMGWRMERKLSDDLNKKERNEELASLQEKREKREIF